MGGGRSNSSEARTVGLQGRRHKKGRSHKKVSAWGKGCLAVPLFYTLLFKSNMIKIIKNYKNNIEKEPIEMVERKGIGHPDTLSDLIAENFSNNYSKYCLDKFGYILNHWVDKVLLSGGTAKLDFGIAEITRPITAYLFGRVTQTIGDEEIDVAGLFKKSVVEVLSNIFIGQKIIDHINYVIDVNQAIGKDHTKEFYFPKSGNEVKKCWDALKCNDTVICSGYAPYSQLEKIVISLENYINSKNFKKKFPETGWDVKVMAMRAAHDTSIVVCLPFIARLTPSHEYYLKKMESAKKEINKKMIFEIKRLKSNLNITSLIINARDQGKFAYLTVFGTALDKGDYGAVGRGNKYSGIISINRESNIEATSGKNPMNHSGKIYTIMANDIAWKIHGIIFGDVFVNIGAKIGDDITNPDFVAIKCSKIINKSDEAKINKIVFITLNSAAKYYKKIISKDVIKNHTSNKLIV